MNSYAENITPEAAVEEPTVTPDSIADEPAVTPESTAGEPDSEAEPSAGEPVAEPTDALPADGADEENDTEIPGIEIEEEEEQETEGTEIVSPLSYIKSHGVAIGAGIFVVLLFLLAVRCGLKRKRAKKTAENRRRSGTDRENETVTDPPAPDEFENYGGTLAMEGAEGGTITEADDDLKKRPEGLYVSKVHNIGKRKSQQDSFGLSQEGTYLNPEGKGVLAIVADGMGGLQNGGEISALVTMSMMKAFDGQTDGLTADQELLRMLNQANQNVNALLQSSHIQKGGSTLVAVIVRGNDLYWLTVGDSHLCLYRDNVLMQINRDHIYGVELDEMAARGEISVQRALEDPQRKALTSYIGMGKIEKIDRNIRPLKLRKGDRLILMSDGIFGTLSDDELTAALHLPVDESAVAIDQMIQARRKPSQDNYTAVILEYV